MGANIDVLHWLILHNIYLTLPLGILLSLNWLPLTILRLLTISLATVTIPLALLLCPKVLAGAFLLLLLLCMLLLLRLSIQKLRTLSPLMSQLTILKASIHVFGLYRLNYLSPGTMRLLPPALALPLSISLSLRPTIKGRT